MTVKVIIDTFLAQRFPGADTVLGGTIESRDGKTYTFDYEHNDYGWQFTDETEIPQKLRRGVEKSLENILLQLGHLCNLNLSLG